MSSVAVPQTSAARVSSGSACVIDLAECEVQIPASALTLDGFCAWAISGRFPERGQISFLDGELIVDMSPEELKTHLRVKGEITYVLTHLVKKRRLGELFPDKALLKNEAANLSTEPDASFASWKTLRAGRIRFVPKTADEEKSMVLEGTPDWVLEVVSDTSVRKDTKKLRAMYHRAGIPEYWLIDARSEEIDFQILTWAGGGYEAAPVGASGWMRSRVFKRRFRLIRKRGPMQLWEYTLQVKQVR